MNTKTNTTANTIKFVFNSLFCCCHSEFFDWAFEKDETTQDSYGERFLETLLNQWDKTFLLSEEDKDELRNYLKSSLLGDEFVNVTPYVHSDDKPKVDAVMIITVFNALTPKCCQVEFYDWAYDTTRNSNYPGSADGPEDQRFNGQIYKEWLLNEWNREFEISDEDNDVLRKYLSNLLDDEDEEEEEEEEVEVETGNA